MMQVLDTTQTRLSLPFKKLITAIESGFQADAEVPLRHHHFIKNETEKDDVLLLMPAWMQEEFGGVKLVNVVPGNRTRGLASISSSYVLFDRVTGEHLLLLDGAELTARRTAAAAALAGKYLSRSDSRRLLVIGAGKVGSQLPYAYQCVRSIDEVHIYNPTRSRAEALVKELKRDGFNAFVADDIENAVKSADIISAATLAKEPVLKGAWLQPGQHVDLIGSFTPEMRETDDLALQRSYLMVDTEHAKIESGDLAVPLKSGAISEQHIKGTLQDLCRDEASGRSDGEQITLFKSVGTAIEDLAGAMLAYRSLTESEDNT